VSAPSHPSGALVAVVASIVLLASGCGSSGTLSAKALSQESKSLQSLAAEGALLARDAQAGRTTRIFRRVHADDLYKVASKSSTSLRTAKTAPGLDTELRKLKFLSGTLSDDLKRLGNASKAELPGLARDLEVVAGTLK
jgi:outer membrane murein-binding lipoprotein Lpp